MQTTIKNFIKEALLEITRYEKETGKKYDPQDVFKKYISDSEIPEYGFTMTEINKVGMNPQSHHTGTPTGVYFYPLTLEYFEMLLDNNLPYASSAPYCSIIKLIGINSEKWLKFPEGLKSYLSDSALERTKSIFPSELVDDVNQDLIVTNYNNDFYPYKLAYILSHDKNWRIGSRKNNTFTHLLRKAGFVGVYDEGNGMIHAAEPTQGVCLSPEAYTVIATFKSSDVRRSKAGIESLKDKLTYSLDKKLSEKFLISTWNKYPDTRSMIAKRDDIPQVLVDEIIASEDASLIYYANKKIPFSILEKYLNNGRYGDRINRVAFDREDVPIQYIFDLFEKPLNTGINSGIDTGSAIRSFLLSSHTKIPKEDFMKLYKKIIFVKDDYFKNQFLNSLATRDDIPDDVMIRMIKENIASFVGSYHTIYKFIERAKLETAIVFMLTTMVKMQNFDELEMVYRILKNPNLDSFKSSYKLIKHYVKKFVDNFNERGKAYYSFIITQKIRDTVKQKFGLTMLDGQPELAIHDDYNF